MNSRADKPEEQRRARAIQRRFPRLAEQLGFIESDGGSCIREFGDLTCRIGLQKFRQQAAFRVIFSVVPTNDLNAMPHVEFSDRWTYRDSPGPRKYDFGIEWGDDASEWCLKEIADFVQEVVIPWAQHQSTSQTTKG